MSFRHDLTNLYVENILPTVTYNPRPINSPAAPPPSQLPKPAFQTRPPVAPPTPPVPTPGAPVAPVSVEQEESISLKRIDDDRKASHAAYNIIDFIYKRCKDFRTADNLIQRLNSIHRKEKKLRI